MNCCTFRIQADEGRVLLLIQICMLTSLSLQKGLLISVRKIPLWTGSWGHLLTLTNEHINCQTHFCIIICKGSKVTVCCTSFDKDFYCCLRNNVWPGLCDTGILDWKECTTTQMLRNRQGVSCKQRLYLLHHSNSLSSERVAVQGQASWQQCLCKAAPGIQLLCQELETVILCLGINNRVRQATDACVIWSHAKQNISS